MIRLSAVLGGLVLATLVTVDAFACSVAFPPNKPVEIASESAVIVWDAANGTQHFIRRATFRSAAEDFGFLVPTPTQPELAEADDAAFTELARITAPKIVKQPRPSSGGCGIGCSSEKSATFGMVDAVQVLDEQRVAGYDAVVLQADSADALAKWLREHGYEFSDPLKAWAEEYIKLKWKITAFKVSKAAAERPTVSSSAVRMSFKTDRPYFPYREPVMTTAYGGPRLLRLYFVSHERVAARVNGTPWGTAWSNLLSSEDRDKVAGLLKLPKALHLTRWWLTEFEDRSSPRLGKADMFFTRAVDQSPVERKPHIEYTASNLGGYMTALATCALLLGIWINRRRRI